MKISELQSVLAHALRDMGDLDVGTMDEEFECYMQIGIVEIRSRNSKDETDLEEQFLGISGFRTPIEPGSDVVLYRVTQ